MEQKGCIYLITCLVNGKKYVGQYKKSNPKGRWTVHLRNAKDGAPYALHGAIRLYGKENFKIEVLCICSHSVLGNLEAYYAEQYGSYIWDPEPGYNMVWCGKHARLGIKLSDESLERIRQSNIGRKHTPEACYNMGQSKIGRVISTDTREKIGKANSGREQSSESIEKRRQALLGKKPTPEVIEKRRQSLLLYHAKKREALSNS